VEASNIGVKNLSPTQIQAIGYANIPSDLDIALGLCISWVVEIHFLKTRQLVNTVKLFFAVPASNIGIRHRYVPQLANLIVSWTTRAELGCT